MTRALLVIDVQEGLIRENPTNKDQFLVTVDQAIASFRAKGDEIIFVQHDTESDFLPVGSQAWQIASNLTVAAADKKISKTHNSAFYQTELEDYLRQQDIDHLLICGMQVEYCVDTTIKVAFEKGFKLTVIKGATTTFDNDGLSGQAIIDFYENQIWRNFAQVKDLADIR